MYEGKKLLITGGTGSFGNAVIRRFLDKGLSEIRVLSRDEKKQDDMRKLFLEPKLKFYLGDVRDYDSVKEAVRGVDYIFHAAALKQVPSCEFFPLEALKTNAMGVENVLNAAIYYNVQKVICLSTDKAVYPINAMGISKAMMEKIAIAKSRNSENTIICITRYGNVIGSRGSVVPHFINQIRSGVAMTLTDPKMTRFMMSLDEAVDLVDFAFSNAKSGEILVQKSTSATIETISNAVKEILDVKDYKTKIIGTRHGEKLYETLLSREEMFKAEDCGQYYRIPFDSRGLEYEKYVENGMGDIAEVLDYSSHLSTRLNTEDLKLMFRALDIYHELFHLNMDNVNK